MIKFSSPPTSIYRRIFLFALLACLMQGQFAQAQSGNLADSDSQRVQIIAQEGGLITASLSLNDGTILAAEGSSLLRLNFGADGTETLDRYDIGYGRIVDLGGIFPTYFVLTERGIVVLRSDDAFALPLPTDFYPGGGQRLLVADGLILVAARDAGLRIYTSSDETQLEHIATLSLTGSVLDVTISADGGRAYIAAGDGGVHIIDLGDHSNPRFVGTLPHPAQAQSVSMVGNLLAVGTSSEIAVIDPLIFSDDEIGRYAPLDQGRRAVVDEDFIYIADEQDGLKIMWLPEPHQPLQVYGESGKPIYDLVLDDNFLYVVGEDGLRILDVSSRYRPLESSRLDLPAKSEAIIFVEGRVYIALGEAGVALVDVANRSQPRLEKVIPIDGAALALVERIGWVYVASGEAGITTINASLPGAEQVASTLQLPGVIEDIERRGKTLYLTADDQGLLAMDITFPDRPVLIGILPPAAGESFHTLSISGARAYITSSDGFTVADINTPDNPSRLAGIHTRVNHIGVVGNSLYALMDSRIRMYDIRATAEPIYLKTYTALSQISELVSVGDTVMAVSDQPGADLSILDFRSPDAPVESGSYGNRGAVLSLHVDAQSIQIAQGSGGLQVFNWADDGSILPSERYQTLAEVVHLENIGDYLVVGGRSGWRVSNGEQIWYSPPSDPYSVEDTAINGDSLVIATGGSEIILYELDDSGESVLIARETIQGDGVVGMDDHFVYVGDSGGLGILGIGNLAPVLRLPMAAPVTDLVLRGEFIILTLLDGSLVIVNKSDPLSGIESLSQIKTDRPNQFVFSLEQNRLYGLADRLMSVIHFDGSRLSLGQEGLLDQPAVGAFFIDGIFAAYPTSGDVQRYDLSFLEDYELTQGTLPLQNDGRQIQDSVSVREYVYLAYGYQGASLYNSQIAAPPQSFAEGAAFTMIQSEQTLFTGGRELSAWDITVPSAPTLIAEFQLISEASDIVIVSETILLVSHQAGVSLLGWDGQSFSRLVNHFTPSAVTQAVASEGFGYLALQSGGLTILDLSDLASPTGNFVWTPLSGEFIYDLYLIDTTHLLISTDSGIELLDIGGEGGQLPEILGTLKLNGSSALDIQVSVDGRYAAVSLGGDGVDVLDLADPAAPVIISHVDTIGDGLAATFESDTLYVADGDCGLRIIDLSDRDAPQEVGFWRGNYVTDLSYYAGNLSVADGNRVVTLRYDATMEAVLPFMPQNPSPALDQVEVSLGTDLSWTGASDACEALTYSVHFGVIENPLLIGSVSGESRLELGELDPGQTYFWRVTVTDGQGDQVRSPIWRFTTEATRPIDSSPPAPPPFLQKMQENPSIPLGLVGVLLVVVAWAIYRQIQLGRDQPNIPDWYSEDHESEE